MPPRRWRRSPTSMVWYLRQRAEESDSPGATENQSCGRTARYNASPLRVSQRQLPISRKLCPSKPEITQRNVRELGDEVWARFFAFGAESLIRVPRRFAST